MTLRQRLYLVLAVLAAVTVAANGFSFAMYLGLAEAAGRLEPKLLAQATETRNWMIAVIVAASVIGLAAFLQLVRMLLNLLGGEPQYVSDVVRRIAGGDFGVRIELKPGDSQSLLAALAGLRANLGEMGAQLTTATKRLREAARDFHAITTNMQKGTVEQAAAAQVAAGAVGQLSAGIEDIAAQAVQVNQLAAASLERTQEGNESLARMLGELAEAESAVGEMTETAREFIGSAASITGMTREVRDIADQTNLLALNAAIEAARAGEQGRGFAVVADEVRKLAERTGNSTQEIAAMIQRIQDASSSVAREVAASSKEVGDGAQSAARAGNMAASVETSVDQAGRAVQSISDSLAESSAATRDIAGNMERISQTAENNARVAQDSLRESRQVGDLAEKLKCLAAQFRA